MPFVEGGIVVDAEPQQQAAPTATQGGFVQGGIEVDPTPEDSYNKVLQYQAAQTDYTPTKQEYLDYLKVSKTKPLLGERPLETVLTAAGQTAVDIAKMPYRLGEAIGQYIEPPEGVMPMDVAAGTAAEIAMQSRLKAEAMARGGYDVALSNLEKLTGKLRSDDDRYEAFLATSEIKRQLARANAPEDQRVPAAQEFLQAYNIPQEAISQPGLEVGGFLADPSSIAFAGGGKAASALLQRAAPLIPRAGAALQRGGERITAIGQAPEAGAGALTTAVTGSPAMGQAVQEAISKGTTGVALGEAAGLPITATMNVPGLGTVSRVIGGTKAAGATMETLGEAGAISGGQTLTPIQRGLLGAGERIAAAEGASAGARAFGTALARSGIEAPAIGAAKILIPTVGAGVGGGLLAGLTGEEGDAIAAAIGSGFAFGAIDSGFRLAKAASSDALNANRVRRTAVDDLNTRPTEVQFTYIDPTTGSEQLSTIKDAESRAKLYASLDNKQLTKALSEVAGAEAGGAEVIFHGNADAVPASLQGIDYAGVAIGPNNIKSGKPTILINVDRAKPETLPHEILHAKITSDVLSQLGSQVIESSVQSPEFQRQFTDFANRYADKLDASGARVTADRIRTELRDAFDPTQQRAQRIENLKRMTDEFAAYYTQEFLKGKDPKTLLPGRIPSFFELAFNNAKEAVAERFTRQALQNGFDPVARTFYDANGKRIKIPWMEDAIKNLISPKEGFEPTEQKVDTRKMTQAQQNALIMARGYSDLFMTAPDGSIVRPLTKAELAAKTADVANRTMKVIETVPQNERTSVSGLDAKGNPVIEGRLSLAEADALSKSGIFSPSTSRYIVDIATAIRDGTLMEGRYWKVYGSTGKSGVFGESEKLFLPYGISINSKGGVNVKAVDWGKVQARMYKALTKPAYKNLFRTYDQAMSTLKDVYLKNIAEQNAVPSAEALGGGIEGAKKRNFFNEVMGAVPKKGDVMINLPTAGYEAGRKGGSVYQDLRIERIQNANLTGNKIPWSGDMGEQSSYRRTQLNFQPAETIGETQVSTDQNGGYRILSKNGKFRLYGPDGSTVGIFDTEGQAKLKAEKDYATQARLQPEVDQQQRPARDEGRQTAEAGRGDRPERGPQGREEGRQELGPVRQAGDVRFMPSSLTARDINAIAVEVGGGDVKGGAKAFGAFMRSMRDKGITLRDVVKSYGITLSSIQRQELPVSTIKKNWPDAPFQEGTKVRPEDAFAQLLGTPEGQKYLNAAERGVFDEQAADAVVQKFRSFGFHNKLKEQMKTAVEQFYPKAQEIIDAVNTMPTDKFIDYVRNNFKGISYGKVGFWSGQLGRGDIPTFDSRQGKLVYGKEVPVTKQVLMEQKDRLTQLGIKVPAAFKDFAQTLLHHEVWDRLNQSDTEHGPIKEAMLRFMPDYSGEHRAPRRDSGAPLDNLKGVYPDDVYGPNAARYYGNESGSQTDKAAVRIIQATKGKPDAPVKVFRAIPKSIESNEINPGDWITTIKSYAVQHGEGPLGGDYKILEKTVPAGDLYTDGNSIFEFGYDPKFMPSSEQDTKALQMLPKPRRSLDAAYQDGVKTRSQDPQFYDVPDYVGYDMARTAAFEMGREGAEPPRWVMAERIGKLPTEGRSKNFAEDKMERGVSALRIVGEPQSDVGTYEMFNPGEKRYIAGWLVGLGSDGEPLLADAIDLGPVSGDVRMMPQPDSSMPGAYSFQGGYRALPGKAKGSLRLYGPAGSLIGIAASLDEAQRIIRRKTRQ